MTEQDKGKTQGIRERILADIRSGDISMRPRIYFTLKIASLALLAGAIVIVSVLLFNLIGFSIRASGHAALLGFGSRGIGAFLALFPWRLLILDILLVFVLQRLFGHFRFGYRIPTLYVVLGLFFATGIAGFFLEHGTLFNERLSVRSAGLPPPLRGFYEEARRPAKKGSGICHCLVLAIEGNRLIVEDPRSGTTTLIVLLPQDDPHATTTGLRVGDRIFIAGDERDGAIEAFGVRLSPYPHPQPETRAR